MTPTPPPVDRAAPAAIVEIALDAEGWQAIDLESCARRALGGAASALGLPAGSVAISVLGCDDARIAGLNADFRQRAGPTDVLSWPAWSLAPATPGATPPALPEWAAGSPPREIGDVALALETCRRDAAAAERSLEEHATHLILHGILHCLGYDHETSADAALMEGLETSILEALGIADPYAARETGPI